MAAMPDEERLEHLANLEGRGGTLGQMATELLAIRKEREARREAERLAAEAEAAVEAGGPDFTDPSFLDGLRASVLASRQATSEAFVAGRRALAEKQYGAEQAAAAVAADRAAVAATDAWLAESDPLFEHPAYQEFVAGKVAASRAAEAARAGRLGYGEDVQEAENYIAAVKAKALAGVGS